MRLANSRPSLPGMPGGRGRACVSSDGLYFVGNKMKMPEI